MHTRFHWPQQKVLQPRWPVEQIAVAISLFPLATAPAAIRLAA